MAVEVFEVTDWFAVMANVFDPVDLLANAAGIVAALALDLAVTRRDIRPAREDTWSQVSTRKVRKWDLVPMGRHERLVPVYLCGA